MPTLNWIGKDAVVNHHRHVPYRLLHCDKPHSAGDPEAGNLLVQGDNLEALKALLPYYAGKVKCIYIDPPYNTGEENWVYNDNVNSPQIKKWLGQVVGKEAEDLTRHDKWLCMMYPRLALLREFLSEDGVLWVSMDESETHLLRLLLDEVFDRNNFLATVIWKKRSSPDARATIGNIHDYLLCYLRHPNEPKKVISKMSLAVGRVTSYKNPDNDPRGVWASVDMTGMTGRATKEQFFEVTLPSGRKMKPPAGRSWGLAEATYLEMLRDNRIWFGKSSDNAPRMKRFLSESSGQVVPSFWDMDAGTNDGAKKELNDILGTSDLFDTPKPTSLLYRVLSISTTGTSLILDSFAGSGTTGHAVLQMNKADGGNRKFILIEMDETIARDVTAQRLRKVVEGYTNAKGDAVEPLGGGFRFCTLGKPLFDAYGSIDPDVKYNDLAAHVFFSETGSPLPKRRSGATGRGTPRPVPGGDTEAQVSGVPATRGTQTDGPLLGTFEGRAVYLLFNGILGDKKPQGGNVLTTAVLESLPEHDGPKVIYGEACRLGETRLRAANVTFKQVPWEVRVG